VSFFPIKIVFFNIFMRAILTIQKSLAEVDEHE